MLIKQKRLINLNKLNAFNLDTIQLGVPATSNDHQAYKQFGNAVNVKVIE